MIPFENDEEIARFFSEGEELIHRKKGLRRYLLAVVKAVKKYHTFIKLISNSLFSCEYIGTHSASVT